MTLRRKTRQTKIPEAMHLLQTSAAIQVDTVCHSAYQSAQVMTREVIIQKYITCLSGTHKPDPSCRENASICSKTKYLIRNDYHLSVDDEVMINRYETSKRVQSLDSFYSYATTTRSLNMQGKHMYWATPQVLLQVNLSRNLLKEPTPLAFVEDLQAPLPLTVNTKETQKVENIDQIYSTLKHQNHEWYIPEI